MLILNDQAGFLGCLPNLGDRALQQGFHRVLRDTVDADLLSGAWKPFAGLVAASRVRRHGEALSLDRCLSRIDRYTEWRARLESKVDPWLRRLVHLPSLSGITRYVEERAGADAMLVLEPRLLPAHSAEHLRTQIRSADLVLMNAAGLLADHLANWLPDRLLQLALAVRLGKPVGLVNHSVALTGEAKTLAAPLLRAIDYHLVREPRSREALLALGVAPERIGVTVDAAFAIATPARPCETAPPRGIGIQVRGDRPVDNPAWKVLMQGLREWGQRIYYFQGCKKHDHRVAESFRGTGLLENDVQFLDVSALLDQFAHRELIITDRYHGMIFAALAGVPFVPLVSTTHKTEGFLELLQYPVGAHPPLSTENVGDLLGTLQEVLRERTALAELLIDRVPKLRQRLREDYGSFFARYGLQRGDVGSRMSPRNEQT